MLFSKNAFNNLQLIHLFSPSYFIKSSIVIFEARALANPATNQPNAKIQLCSKTPVTISLISCSWGTYLLTEKKILLDCSLCKKLSNSPSRYPTVSCWWKSHSMSCSYVGNTSESCHPTPTSLCPFHLHNQKVNIRQNSQLEEGCKVQFGKREIRPLEEDWNYCDRPSITVVYVLVIVCSRINDNTYYRQAYSVMYKHFDILGAKTLGEFFLEH